jgi:isopenicillin N synthase-like dioxygenase
MSKQSAAQNIPVVDLRAPWPEVVRGVGLALEDIGFFAVAGHGVDEDLTRAAYDAARAFFALPQAAKDRYHLAHAKGQRGYTGFGTEKAKDARTADLKEFWQVGRVGVADDHPVHRPYGPNLWPDAEVAGFHRAIGALYQRLDALGAILLEACAEHVGEPRARFRDWCTDSDTIVRVIYYPPVADDAPPGAVRSAAHEDINLITLLSSATAEGLELLQRDGTWRPVHTGFDTIVVDAGDMLQHATNGLYKSTTHRVVNPPDARSDRFSMPCFIHPRTEVDLAPLPSCIARTGGAARYPSLTAGEYLAQRLREIGLDTRK